MIQSATLEKKSARTEELYLRDDKLVPNLSTDLPIQIREVECCNEFIAVLPFTVPSEIKLPDGQQFKEEGIVIGVGPGLPNATGRCPSQFKVGDIVLFQSRSIPYHTTTTIPPMAGKMIYIMSERNIFCKLASLKFEVVK